MPIYADFEDVFYPSFGNRLTAHEVRCQNDQTD